MNREILLIAEQIKDVYEGDPWFGRSVKAILAEVDESIAFKQPNGQHSIVELLWHMINWKEFVISRFLKEKDPSVSYFETNDWKEVDLTDKTLWKQGLQLFNEKHIELLDIIRQQNDDILTQKVHERNYDFRKLLRGIIDHDIYHLGQIAYIKKQLKSGR